jgi:hypothetical protein
VPSGRRKGDGRGERAARRRGQQGGRPGRLLLSLTVRSALRAAQTASSRESRSAMEQRGSCRVQQRRGPARAAPTFSDPALCALHPVSCRVVYVPLCVCVVCPACPSLSFCVVRGSACAPLPLSLERSGAARRGSTGTHGTRRTTPRSSTGDAGSRACLFVPVHACVAARVVCVCVSVPCSVCGVPRGPVKARSVHGQRRGREPTVGATNIDARAHVERRNNISRWQKTHEAAGKRAG